MKNFTITSSLLALVSSLLVSVAATAQSFDSPQARLQPIGAPSAVDRFRRPQTDQRFRETDYRSNPAGQTALQGGAVRQAALLQQPGGGMSMPGGFTPPAVGAPSDAAPVAPPQLSSGPATQAPARVLPVSPAAPPVGVSAVPTQQSILVQTDQVPIAAPQLHDGFATIDNCNCVSPPSNYVASLGPCDSAVVPCSGYAPVTYQAPVTQAVVAPQVEVAPPAVVPVVPAAVPAPRRAGIPKGPLISFGQDRNPVQVGQGLFGQPVAYVPGQRFRNWIRYIFP